MKYKSVLLVSPRFYKGRNRLSHFPLIGLGYIAEALYKIDLHDGMDFDFLLKEVQAATVKYHALNTGILSVAEEILVFIEIIIIKNYKI